MQRDIPVIVDEVFTGMWRLGAISGAKLLGIEPDIACYGKLLTGGMLPVGVTLAREDVFDAFEGEDKVKILFFSCRDALVLGIGFVAWTFLYSVSSCVFDGHYGDEYFPYTEIQS